MPWAVISHFTVFFRGLFGKKSKVCPPSSGKGWGVEGEDAKMFGGLGNSQFIKMDWGNRATSTLHI